jgi:dTDP-4-amino-4,6-dideoxygalactose transaminase
MACDFTRRSGHSNPSCGTGAAPDDGAMEPVAFFDLRREVAEIRSEVDAMIGRVLDSGRFILGREGKAFEDEFGDFLGAAHVVGVSSGTDALRLALEGVGVRAGDEVITVPNTAAPTVAAIMAVGAHPVFVDVDDATLMMDAAALPDALGVRTAAIVPAHLFGHAAPVVAILDHARGVPVVEDCAQAVGCRLGGVAVGRMGRAGCFSFYPTKNLGAYGDAGCVVTSDGALAARLRLLRNHGQQDRYRHDLAGHTSRLDEIQAAILRAKLKHLPAWLSRRREIANHYRKGITHPLLRHPQTVLGAHHAYHLYPVRVPGRQRIVTRLEALGIDTLIHYPVPLHLQRAFAHLGYRGGDFPMAERAANEILSLPLYPQMSDGEVERVIDAMCIALDEVARG